MDYFKMQMSLTEVNQMSMLGLAHVGDAVYELLTRTMLCSKGAASVSAMHKNTVRMVNAVAQAEAVNIIMDKLTPDELAVFKRGRNTRVNSVPHNADISQYHAATGLEALFGWLYLQGKTERVIELYGFITEENKDAT